MMTVNMFDLILKSVSVMFVLIFISIFVFAILTNIVQLYLLIQVFP